MIATGLFAAVGCLADILTDSNLLSFSANPRDMIVCYSNGLSYGTTVGGGNLGQGVIFRISANWTLTNLFLFSGTNGQLPYGGLVLGNDGNFYGTTEAGGASEDPCEQLGTIFKISPDGNFASLFSFQGTNGCQPMSRLTSGSDGNLYGTTWQGGPDYQPDYYPYNYGYGVIFKVSTNGCFTFLASFNRTNGFRPMGALLEVTNGVFYGAASAGGPFDDGTIYQVTAAGGLTTVAVFDGTNGSSPQAGLTRGQDGCLYGTTYGGGASNAASGAAQGTVFTLRNGTIRTLCTFLGTGDIGANPDAGVIQGTDGNLYGTTLIGGLYDFGTIYRATTRGMLTTLYSFHDDFALPLDDGAFPYGNLMQTPDGYFYGICGGGGRTGAGTLYCFPMPPTIDNFELRSNSRFLQWNSVSNGIYQVQCTANISCGSWSNMGGSITATNFNCSAIDVSPEAQAKFYRVLLLQ